MVAVVLATISAVQWYNESNGQRQINERLEKTYTSTMNRLNASSKALQDVQKQKMDIESSLKTKEQENAKKQQEIESLRSQVQAKAAVKASLARVTPKSIPVSGTCSEWISSAGITDIANAWELIRRESGCNPNIVNKISGACGVAQELPCGKSGCSLGDGACQVRWMNTYVHNRYGSWSGAIAHHNAKNWY